MLKFCKQFVRKNSEGILTTEENFILSSEYNESFLRVTRYSLRVTTTIKGVNLMYTRFLSVLIVLIFTSTLSCAGEYWIKVQNTEGGEITVSKDKGNSWNNIGNVLIPVNELTEPNQPGFTAADYGSDSSIVATAVNAIHIRISKPGRFSRIFSLLPIECKDLDKDYKSYHGSAIITDIEGEYSIFGKDYAPYIGNRVK